MKTIDILKEEAKKEGLELAEVACQKTIKVIKSTLARAALEADEEAFKAVAPIGTIVVTALDPMVEKLIDFNHDGKIGE